MAVPKIAVVALVLIVACPILLGFGMNFEDGDTQIRYNAGDYTDVTRLLSDSSAYSFVDTNTFENNSMNFAKNYGTGDMVYPSTGPTYYPDYQVSPVYSSIPLEISDTITDGEIVTLTDYSVYDVTSALDMDNLASGQLKVRFHETATNTWTGWHSRVTQIVWDPDDQYVNVVWHLSDGEEHGNTYGIVDQLEYDLDNYTETPIIKYVPISGSATYADLSKGYTMPEPSGAPNNYIINWWVAPAPIRSAIFTIDMSDVTDGLTFRIKTESEYYASIVATVTKTTTLGVTTLELPDGTEMYYDDSAPSNTYQVIISKTGMEWRYVGGWPSTIGNANYYTSYTYEWPAPVDYDDFIVAVQIEKLAGQNPTMRVESSSARGMITPVVADKEYNPASFFTDNSITTINVRSLGSSITFGGNTYNVGSDGNITLGTHKVSAYKLTFETSQNLDGTYSNKINGNTVSTTAAPSKITFNGQWGMISIESAAMTGETFNDLVWVAGSFAWDGMDDNFLLVGLITSLGVFIALGIYGRRSGAKVLPLMIVCGGAALLFFIMI